jgi:fibronectin-binding autotransporter adhesin
VAGGSGTFSGTLQNDASARLGIVKIGAGTEILSGTNTYSGGTVINGGTLVINGTAGSGAVTVSGGTLAGIGAIAGPVSIGTNGNLAPGDPMGALTIANTLSLAGNTCMALNSGANSTVAGLTAISYGGTLTVTNLGGLLIAGNTFPLFSAASASGNFVAIAGNAGNGLGYIFNPTNGILTVVPAMPTSPTNLAFSVSSGVMTVKWPASYTGWILQAQTNPPTKGLTTNWTDVPGSAAVDTMTFPITRTNSVFFRLRLP